MAAPKGGPPIDPPAWPDEALGSPPPPPAPARPALVVADADGRPDVRITPNTHQVTAQLLRVLEGDPDVYQRDRRIVRVLAHQAVPGQHRSRRELAVGTPVIEEAPLTWLVDRVSARARCIRTKMVFGKPAAVHIPPPIQAIRHVAEARCYEWVDAAAAVAGGDRARLPRRLRTLTGIAEAPCLRDDGTVLQTPGYDERTGYLFLPSSTYLEVADEPTHADAVLAFARLADVFRDFPYVDPSHKSAAVAAILTLLARPAITGACPVWIFDAATQRSGKSLQMDAISLITSGRCASRMTYPEDDAELEKVLASYALAGVALIPFDNVARGFGGAALDKVATAEETVDLRVLGSSEIRRIPWVSVVFASGNNVTTRGDMLPRVLSPRLECDEDNPETRTGLRDLRAYCREARAELVHAGLTLLRAYQAAGAPAQPRPVWGGFESWAHVVADALLWTGAPSPLGARRGMADDDDPVRQHHAALVAGWARLAAQQDPEHEPSAVTLSNALRVLYPSHRDEGPPDGFDELREAIEGLAACKPGYAPSSSSLGRVMRSLKARPVGGKKLIATKGDWKTRSAGWAVVPVRRT